MGPLGSITSRCNASCAFCAWKDETSQRDELTTTEIKTLHRAARQAGFVWLTFWGGEPLVRSDIGEISSYASHLGFTCTLVTNGSLLAKKMDRVVPCHCRQPAKASPCFSVAPQGVATHSE